MISLTEDLKERLKGIEPQYVGVGQRTDLLIFEIVKAAKLPVQDYSLDLGLTFPLLWTWLCEKVKEFPQASVPLYPPDIYLSTTRLKVGVGDAADHAREPFLQKFDHLEAIHLCRAVIFVAKNLPEEGGD